MTTLATEPRAAVAPTAPASARRRNPFVQRGFRTLFVTELKLWLRDTADMLWLLMPTGMMLAYAFLNDAVIRERLTGEEWRGWAIYGYAPVTAHLPMTISFALVLAALFLPVSMGSHRELGVLKMLSATPMRPQALFAANFLLAGFATAISAGIAVSVATALFPIALPQNAAIVVVGAGAGLAATLAIGALISALVATASQGMTFGSITLLILIAAAGLLGGAPDSGSFMYNVARISPLGAAVQVMNYGWLGSTATLGEPTSFPWVQLVALVLWTGVLAPLAVKLFRWR